MLNSTQYLYKSNLSLINESAPAGFLRSKIQFEAHRLEDGCLHRQLSTKHNDRLSGYEVIWIKSGSGSFWVDMEKYDIRDNMLYLLRPGQRHLFKPNEGMQGYRIWFSDEFLYMSGGQTTQFLSENQRAKSLNLPMLEISREIQNDIEEIVRAMIREYATNFQFKADILKGLLRVLMVYFSRKFEFYETSGSRCADSELFENFKSLIRKNILIKKTVSEYARDLAVTPCYLSDVVKKASGFTANHHIQQGIVHEAKRRAICLGESMKEIAYYLGFNDIAHFSKFFKNQAGINFSEFKKTIA